MKREYLQSGKKKAKYMTAAHVARAGVTKESFEARVGPGPGLEEGPYMSVWEETFQKGPSQAKAWRQGCVWSRWMCDTYGWTKEESNPQGETGG